MTNSNNTNTCTNYRVEIIALLQKHFAGSMASVYVNSVEKKLSINLDCVTEEELAKFLMYLFDESLSKFKKGEELEKMKMMAFHKFLGAENSIKYFSNSDFKIKPISFLSFSFGDRLGEILLHLGEIDSLVADIHDEPIVSQTVFTKKIINSMFSHFPSNMLREALLRFLIFLKFGEDDEASLLRFYNIALGNNDEGKLIVFKCIFNYCHHYSPKILDTFDDDMLNVLLGKLQVKKLENSGWMYRLKSELKWIGHRTIEAEDQFKYEDPEKISTLLNNVLTSYFGAETANDMLSLALKKTGAANVDESTHETRSDILRYLHESREVSLFRVDKRKVLEKKIGWALLR